MWQVNECEAVVIFSPRNLTILILAAAFLSSISCGRTEAVIPIDTAFALQAVRDYGRRHQPTSDIASKSSPDKTSSASKDLEALELYEIRMSSLLDQSNFDQLEKEARQVRSGKDRVVSGVWKLLAFYEAVSNPSTGGRAQDSDWKSHLAKIKKWVSTQPESATARITLAETYINYGAAARGTDYANTVSQSGWDLYAKRVALAKSTLVEAAKLKEKCPYWYEVMQQIALAEGWEKSQARELFDQAAAFEPTYYRYYREYANFLLPKWYGEEGETQAFAEEVAAHVPDPDGSIIYFEIASLMACQCDKERDSLEGVSWARVKQGYSYFEKLYGTSNLKRNRFAYMAFVAGDKSAAEQTFASIGNFEDHSVWRSSESFESARAWATAP